MSSTPSWLAAAEAMLNRSIESSSQAAQLARRLDATSLQIEVGGAANRGAAYRHLIRVRAAMHGGRLALVSVDSTRGGQPRGGQPRGDIPLGGQPAGDAAPADAVISGSVRAFMAMLRAARPAAAEERAAVTIKGDAEIANLYRQLFVAARPDWEEELARWIGDAPARSLSRLAGGVIGWARRTRRVMGENLAEYLQEESRDLVTRTEVEEFLEGVDQVRETADRIEARLQALQRRMRDGV
jgi:ubiquinone biosynthesis protein UbiJ